MKGIWYEWTSAISVSTQHCHNYHDMTHYYDKRYLDLVSNIADNGFICDLICSEVMAQELITPQMAMAWYFLSKEIKSWETFTS